MLLLLLLLLYVADFLENELKPWGKWDEDNEENEEEEEEGEEERGDKLLLLLLSSLEIDTDGLVARRIEERRGGGGCESLSLLLLLSLALELVLALSINQLIFERQSRSIVYQNSIINRSIVQSKNQITKRVYSVFSMLPLDCLRTAYAVDVNIRCVFSTSSIPN